jgi:hypothetical protein
MQLHVLSLKTSMFIQQQKIAFAHVVSLHCCVSLHRGSLLVPLGINCSEWCPIHKTIKICGHPISQQIHIYRMWETE